MDIEVELSTTGLTMAVALGVSCVRWFTCNAKVVVFPVTELRGDEARRGWAEKVGEPGLRLVGSLSCNTAFTPPHLFYLFN